MAEGHHHREPEETDDGLPEGTWTVDLVGRRILVSLLRRLRVAGRWLAHDEDGLRLVVDEAHLTPEDEHE